MSGELPYPTHPRSKTKTPHPPSVPPSKSPSVFLCFGLAAAFSFTVGSGKEDFGVPNRSREFAFTAFVTENAFFFDFAIGVFPLPQRASSGYSPPHSQPAPHGSILFLLRWAQWKSVNFSMNGQRCERTP